MQVKFGMKILLEKTPVSTIVVKLPNGPKIGPGQKSPLVVAFTEPNGKVLQTEGKGGGKVMWKQLQVSGNVVSVNKSGVVSLDRDPRLSDRKMGHVVVTVPSHPDLRAELDIPFRYDIRYVSYFSGATGWSGANGFDGASGTAGSSGSTDPNNPSPGGNGTNGSDGSNGGDGGQGGDAPPVDVQVALQAGDRPLLQVSVSGLGRHELYLVDPAGGSLTVHADGGPGGSGGRGGRGGQGGMGGTGTPNGNSGSNGMDGRNGSDGPVGRGGLITVTYDPDAEPYLNAIHFSHLNGPEPDFRKESIPLLW